MIIVRGRVCRSCFPQCLVCGQCLFRAWRDAWKGSRRGGIHSGIAIPPPRPLLLWGGGAQRLQLCFVAGKYFLIESASQDRHGALGDAANSYHLRAEAPVHAQLGDELVCVGEQCAGQGGGCTGSERRVDSRSKGDGGVVIPGSFPFRKRPSNVRSLVGATYKWAAVILRNDPMIR